MDVFVARQPILNRHRRLFAYELLYRSGTSNVYPGGDGNSTTSSLLSSSFLTIGLGQLANGHKVFINFTEEMILRGVPSMFPAHQVVVEILEDVNPTREVVAICQSMVDHEYLLALDDFVYAEKYIPLLQLAGIVKVDFSQCSPDEIEQLRVLAKQYHCRLLAEKIETYQDYALASSMGFDYFQGYFFARPEVVRKKEISASHLISMQLIAEVNRAEFDVKRLEQLVKQDVAVSYKLLKYINSAYYSRLQPLASIRQAIAYLGERGTRMFVSLIATSQLSENKPEELLRTSCIRARFLELIAREQQRDPGLFFLLGLLSLLDAMLDMPMDELMKQLPIASELTDALVHREGELFQYLDMVETYEAGRWAELDTAMERVNLHGPSLVDLYLEAVNWTGFFV